MSSSPHFIMVCTLQSEMSQLANRLEDVLGKMKAFKDQLKQVSQDLEGTKSLLEAMAKKTGVDLGENETDDK